MEFNSKLPPRFQCHSATRVESEMVCIISFNMRKFEKIEKDNQYTCNFLNDKLLNINVSLILKQNS